MTEIVIRTSFAALHRWPDAPPRRKYLADAHRHLFTFVVACPVSHANRDVEFHDLIDAVTDCVVQRYQQIGSMLLDFRDQSCEMLAFTLAEDLMRRMDITSSRIEVWEDNENGAVWTADR